MTDLNFLPDPKLLFGTLSIKYFISLAIHKIYIWPVDFYLRVKTKKLYIVLQSLIEL